MHSRKEMIMEYLVSVIMPVYNASKYLAASIDSVLKQTYKNWELLCVDDGSTDNSFTILNTYSQKDKRIKIFSQENSGPAQARRYAIENSVGQYVTYLDADDILSEDFIDKTLSSAVKSGADVTMPILMYDCFSSNFESQNFNKRHNLVEGSNIEPRDAFLKTFPWRVHGLNLYKSCHIKKYALTELSNINNYNADEYLTRYLLLYAKKIVISGGVYFYRANENSISRAFSLRMLGTLIVNDELFKLALKENFKNSILIGIAQNFYRQKIALKLQIIMSRNIISHSDFKSSMQKINIIYSWNDYIQPYSLKNLKYTFFEKSPVNLVYTIIKLKKIISFRG